MGWTPNYGDNAYWLYDIWVEKGIMPHAGGVLDQPQAWIDDMRALSLYEEMHELQAQRPEIGPHIGKDDDE